MTTQTEEKIHFHDPVELAQLESHFDNVAHELLSDLDDAAALDAYYEFRKILQQRIQAKYPTLNFANF
jgi:hypothetical protein